MKRVCENLNVKKIRGEKRKFVRGEKKIKNCTRKLEISEILRKFYGIFQGHYATSIELVFFSCFYLSDQTYARVLTERVISRKREVIWCCLRW